MNIVHVICSLYTGGAELLLIDLAKRQADLGNNVSIVVINNVYEQPLIESIDKRINIQLIHRPEGSRNPLYHLRLYLTIKRRHPDIIHFHNDSAAKIASLFRKTICVGTVHRPGINICNYNKLNCVYAISQTVADDLMSRHGLSSEIILNGINFDAIKCKTAEYIQSETFRIIQTGRVQCKVKGQDIMVRAIEILSKEGRNVSVDFIGEPYDSEILTDLAAELDISDRIRILGRKSREYIYTNLCNYNLGAMPSRYEGFGLTLVEAMAAKIPVVATNVDGPAEILMDNRYGLLCNPEDPEDLARAIAQVMDNYPEYSALAQGQAYNYAHDNFSIDATAAHYIRAYNNLTKTKRNKKTQYR